MASPDLAAALRLHLSWLLVTDICPSWGLPHDGPAGAVPVDGLGSGLLGGSMVALIYGADRRLDRGWMALPILSLAAGAVLLGGSARVKSVTFIAPFGPAVDE